MSLNKSLCLALGVTAGMLIATNAMATDYAESFESVSVPGDLSLAGWGGYGSYTNTEDQSSLPAGTPIATTHSKHLAVDGWVTNTLEGTTGDAQLDMLVKVARPDEELSGMSDTEAKFAMAIDTNGLLKCWLNNAWVALSSTAFTEGQWIRVAVIYDDDGQRCKVSVDGNACVTSSGFKAATGDDTNGPWYPVIRTTSAISSLKVVGTTALDDIKVAYGTTSTPEYKDASGNPITIAKTPATGSDVNIPLKWFDENNVATSATTAPDSSGMTIADKYQTGMDPNGNEKFEMKSMTMTQGETVTATITVPACTPPSGSVKIQTSTDKSSWDAGTAVAAGAESVDVTLKSGNVTYFRMVLDK